MAETITFAHLVRLCLTSVDHLVVILDPYSTSLSRRVSLVSDLDELEHAIKGFEAEHGRLRSSMSQSMVNTKPLLEDTFRALIGRILRDEEVQSSNTQGPSDRNSGQEEEAGSLCNEYSHTTDPWRSLRLLSLEDNNPVQGMVVLYVLEVLMDHVAEITEEDHRREIAAGCSASTPPLLSHTPNRNSNRWHHLRPCDYFDYISGIGTGGLSAILLGVMGLSVPEAIIRVEQVPYPVLISTSASPTPISASQTVQQLTNALRDRLSPSTPTQEHEGPSRSKSDGPGLPLQTVLRVEGKDCKAVCITAREVNKRVAVVHIFRLYGDRCHASTPSLPDVNADRVCAMPILDACLATVAPLLTSTAVRIKDVAHTDATTLDVSPTWRTYKEAERRRHVSGIECSFTFRCHRRTSHRRSTTSEGIYSPGSGGSKTSNLGSGSHSHPNHRPPQSAGPPSSKPRPRFRDLYNRLLESQFPGALHTLDIPGSLEKSPRRIRRGFLQGRRAHVEGVGEDAGEGSEHEVSEGRVEHFRRLGRSAEG